MKKPIILFLILMNVAWAGTYSATKVLMEHAPFYLVTSLRYLLAVAPLLGMAWFRHGLSMNRGDWLRTAAMGIATFTLCPVLMYAGVGMSRSSDAAILTSMEPLLVSMGAYLYLREKIDRRTGIALITAFFGALLLSEFWKDKGAVSFLGTLLIVCGVYFESLYSVIGKKLIGRHPALKIMALALLCGCVVNVIALTALGLWPEAAGLTGSDWALMGIYLSLICTLVGYTVWLVALAEDAAAKVAITIFTQPVVGIVIAWIWVNEVPTAAQIVGTAVILGAVAAALVRFGKKPMIQSEKIIATPDG